MKSKHGLAMASGFVGIALLVGGGQSARVFAQDNWMHLSFPLPVSAITPAQRLRLTPSQVVKHYYDAVAAHQTQAAVQFLAPTEMSLQENAPDSDLNDVRSLTHLHVSPASPGRLDQRYQDEAQVNASYDAQFYQIITAPSGPQTKFIYLGRNGSRSPWHIISIGSGP